VERLILPPHLPAIALLVVDMASTVVPHETILAGMVTFAAPSQAQAHPFLPGQCRPKVGAALRSRGPFCGCTGSP
jgi:hypothetical protein